MNLIVPKKYGIFETLELAFKAVMKTFYWCLNLIIKNYFLPGAQVFVRSVGSLYTLESLLRPLVQNRCIINNRAINCAEYFDETSCKHCQRQLFLVSTRAPLKTFGSIVTTEAWPVALCIALPSDLRVY